MKPLRKVLGILGHAVPYNLECGHIVYRLPNRTSTKIPGRMQCELCERDALELHERKMAHERGREEVIAKLREFAEGGAPPSVRATLHKLLELCNAKVSNDGPSDSEKRDDETKIDRNKDGTPPQG